MAQNQTIRHLSRADRRKVYLKMSDLFFDLGKLVFAGIILTGIVNMEVNDVALFTIGGIVTFILIVAGYLFFIRSLK